VICRVVRSCRSSSLLILIAPDHSFLKRRSNRNGIVVHMDTKTMMAGKLKEAA
jgi:hypothetical protein